MSASAEAAVRRVEAQWDSLARARRNRTILFAILFLLAFAASVEVGEVKPGRCRISWRGGCWKSRGRCRSWSMR
jgi:hypothetical protein